MTRSPAETGDLWPKSARPALISLELLLSVPSPLFSSVFIMKTNVTARAEVLAYLCMFLSCAKLWASIGSNQAPCDRGVFPPQPPHIQTFTRTVALRQPWGPKQAVNDFDRTTLYYYCIYLREPELNRLYITYKYGLQYREHGISDLTCIVGPRVRHWQGAISSGRGQRPSPCTPSAATPWSRSSRDRSPPAGTWFVCTDYRLLKFRYSNSFR